MVYFLKGDRTGMICIGWTHSYDVVLPKIRQYCSESITEWTTMPKGFSEACQIIQNKFASLRDHDNWFNPSFELSDFIRDIDQFNIKDYERLERREKRFHGKLAQFKRASNEVEAKKSLKPEDAALTKLLTSLGIEKQ